MVTISQRWMRPLTVVCGVCLTFVLATSVSAKSPEPELNAKGEELRDGYAQMLDTLSKEIAAELPAVDAEKKAALESARAELAALKAPREDDAPAVHKAYLAAKPLAEAKALDSARPLLADAKALLASDALDSNLMKIAILRHGTPAGLAEFAQQGKQQAQLVEQLLEPVRNSVVIIIIVAIYQRL